MQISPYLQFNGQCAEAFKFYEQCLEGKLEGMMTYGESPMAEQTPAEWRGKIMHAALRLDGQILMGADSPPGQYQSPQGFSVTVTVEQTAQAERMFPALAQGGKITMPLQETFWALRFGMLVDRYGIPWMINCMKPMQQEA